MTDIQELLEREGVLWAPRMDCPKCRAEKKVTANEKIGFAQCWGCGARWSQHSDRKSDWAAFIAGSSRKAVQGSTRRVRTVPWMAHRKKDAPG